MMRLKQSERGILHRRRVAKINFWNVFVHTYIWYERENSSNFLFSYDQLKNKEEIKENC